MATLLEILHEKTTEYDWAVGESVYISPMADLHESVFPELVKVNGYTFERASGIADHFREYRCISTGSMPTGSYVLGVRDNEKSAPPLPFDDLPEGGVLTQSQWIAKYGHTDIWGVSIRGDK